jgi:hypothetical protein
LWIEMEMCCKGRRVASLLHCICFLDLRFIVKICANAQ